MSMYENLVMQTQMNYSRYYGTYAAGKTPVRLSDREALPYEKQIEKLIEKIKEAPRLAVLLLFWGFIYPDLFYLHSAASLHELSEEVRTV